MQDPTQDTARRDRWGRYLVLPPEGKKPKGYTRATTVAKVLDDQGNLINWKSRMTALGLAARPDLLGKVALADPDDKRTVDGLAEEAAEAAGSTTRREQGTVLHAILEQSWENPADVPDMFRNDVEAVHRALAEAGLEPLSDYAETMVVRDDLEVAGTFDLLVSDGNQRYVADIKTGGTLSYGAVGFAIQLAIYAGADDAYRQGAAADGSEDERVPMPRVDQQRGLIIHVEPNSGHCDLYWIDLEFGAKALDLALAVRETRKGKPLTEIAR